jgi:hypothetical protein
MTEGSSADPDRLEASGSIPEPPTAASRGPGKRLRFPIATERTLFALTAFSLLTGLASALSYQRVSCSGGGYFGSVGPLVLLCSGAISAVAASVVYLYRLGHSDTRRSVHLVGWAAITLAGAEIVAALIWAFAYGLLCVLD